MISGTHHNIQNLYISLENNELLIPQCQQQLLEKSYTEKERLL